MDEYLKTQSKRIEGEFFEFLRLASVSADPERRGDIRAAAHWVANRFQALGFANEVIETSGHPLVYAESPHVPGAPTVLVYGHYDVQPADPLDLWISPPFEPTVRDGNVYARGATDDKGQVLTHIYSAQAWIDTQGRLPINLKYIIEGEEEVGSESLEHFLADADQSARLACDCIVISDGSQFAPGRPAITYGLRGIAYFELALVGPNRDLHSGSFGGSVTNPANALATMLAVLINEQGKIQVPGFYDDVLPLSPLERSQFAALGFNDQENLAQVGVSGAIGEEGYTMLERRWARPTFDINGLTSGYQGQGAKTVLPAAAAAKFSFRLVPNQDPVKIGASLRRMLIDVCPAGIRMTLTEHHNSPGVMVPLESPYVQAAARAIERAFGCAPVYTREGGSIPIVSMFREKLGADVLLVGWGQEDDNTHSPNEKFSLADFHRGIAASAHLWGEIGAIAGKA
jgi:acetylornithine deacetylase/succinyl-diaminopimelate desuccinylase-like protein